MENYRPVVMIPFYNHYDAFESFYEKLKVLALPLLVVNDGSSKAEAEKLHKLGLRVIDLKRNCGKGFAVRVGMKEALALGYSHLLQLDADGQHNIEDIAKFLELSSNNPDAIINSVPQYDESAPKANVFGHKFTNFWVRLETASRDIADAMCGFRVYPIRETLPVFEKMKFLRMGFDIEIIVRAFWSGIRIINTETKVQYLPNGVSHFKVIGDNLKISLLHSYLCILAPFQLCRRKKKATIHTLESCSKVEKSAGW